MERSKRDSLFPSAPRPLLFAHRGCSKAAPENSLAAFRKALDYGVPGVELDIHLCRSGEIVVTHDFELERVTGHRGTVEETDFETIRSLDAGAWFSEDFRGERIPLLEEVFDLLGENVYYDIEIKSSGKAPSALEKRLAELIRERGYGGRVLVSSFNPFAVLNFRRVAPEVATAVIYTNHSEVPPLLRHGEGRFIARPTAIKPDRRRVGAVQLFFHQKVEGYPVLVWTEDDPEEARRLVEMGVDGIISNVPERLMKVLGPPI